MLILIHLTFHFHQNIFFFNFISMIFNTLQAGLSLAVLCCVLKIMFLELKFNFEANTVFDSC